ncbi:MAG: hypothetical protein WBG98_06630, partial [Brucella anthropi]
PVFRASARWFLIRISESVMREKPEMRGCDPENVLYLANEEVATTNDSLFKPESCESLLTCGVNDGITTVRTRKRTETGDIRCCKAASRIWAGKVARKVALSG